MGLRRTRVCGKVARCGYVPFLATRTKSGGTGWRTRGLDKLCWRSRGWDQCGKESRVTGVSRDRDRGEHLKVWMQEGRARKRGGKKTGRNFSGVWDDDQVDQKHAV